MRLLYLSYWGIDDGLTQATVFPHLQVLHAAARIDHLLFVTVERGPSGRFVPGFDAPRIEHVGLDARRSSPALLARALDFRALPAALAHLCRQHAVTHLLARGAHAGALAHLMQRHYPVPYMVESFEPHSTYMLESGVWSRWDPRYVFQRRWEAAQKREATVLLPVADAYRLQLLEEGVPPERVVTLPCTVDTTRFQFSSAARRDRRAQFGVAEGDVVGVYVGKFGGTYYGPEAFRIFVPFAREFPGFRLLVLTAAPQKDVEALAAAEGFPRARLIVTAAPHADVPSFLSAADVAFATVRPVPSRRFCSPVKVGEYWASGLPLVITEGVGDDSQIVREHGVGAVVDLSGDSLAAAVSRVRALLAEDGHRSRIATLAERFRSRGLVREAYARIGLL